MPEKEGQMVIAYKHLGETFTFVGEIGEWEDLVKRLVESLKNDCICDKNLILKAMDVRRLYIPASDLEEIVDKLHEIIHK